MQFDHFQLSLAVDGRYELGFPVLVDARERGGDGNLRDGHEMRGRQGGKVVG